MAKLKDKVEGWKATAELFLNNNRRVFLKDVNNNWYFADILFVGEETIRIICFAPASREGESYTLYWTMISEFEEYREMDA